jgi:DNA (cytosine-5)-methyltransferase 1
MNYLSVCSGIEAATVAWHHMGWKPVGFSEIEKFPSQVLAHHYPQVTNFGDMTKYKEWKLNDSIGLLVGGTPCQSFSVAGLRKGLDDPRGNLALTYVGILDKFRPKWCVWENVPGVLSSGNGRDFGAFLGALGELGYGWAYRVLNAENFGVAQRRRRVFVVGCLGSWESASKVLFESESLSGNNQKGRGKKEEITSSIRTSIVYGGSNPECADTVTSKWAKGSGGPSGNECGLFVAHKVYENHPSDSRVKEMGEVCQTVTSTWGMGGGNIPFVQKTYALQGAGSTSQNANGNGYKEEQSYTLNVTDVHGVATNMAVRRLTEVECERLQGFPDNYTNIKENCPSGVRYKALGNSMAVPVMRWIGERINNYERL